MSVTIHEIREATRELGLFDRPICVHSSLRSFGWVEGGARTVIDGLLLEGCTVLVPTFSCHAFAIPPPAGMRPTRNAWDYGEPSCPRPGSGRVYTPEAMDIDDYMGAIPAAILAIPGRVRGQHPLCSFTAVGPLASEMIAGQSPLDVFAPLKSLADMDGAVVLMGVGFGSMTLLHLAEQLAGRCMFRRWANGPGYRPMQVDTGGCSQGFARFEPILAPMMVESKVGESLWRVLPAGAALSVATKTIIEDPSITRCDEVACNRCDDAIAGGPIMAADHINS